MTASPLLIGGTFLALAALAALPAAAGELPLGAPGPAFTLPGVDGDEHALADLTGERGTVIVFTSNRCPYSLLYEPRLLALAREWQPRGFAFVAINPNDAAVQPGEDLDDMKRHAESRRFPFPYLQDAGQAVADAYGARVTPHVFVLDVDGRLAYRGRIDDAAYPEEVTQRDLLEALAALSRGAPVQRPATRAFGCSIKRTDDAGR